jgi:hypothetical protein
MTTYNFISPKERKFDIIIFGSTGFTGQLACEYLEQTLQNAIKYEQVKADKRVYQNDREFHQ